MMRFALLLVITLALATGCSENSTQPVGPTPPDTTSDPGSLLIERTSVCLAHNALGDTLFIHNLGTKDLEWFPTSVPAGSSNLATAFTVPPGTVTAVVWNWDVASSLPQSDSLVVLTSDPLQPRVTIPFLRVAAGHVPPGSPPAPKWLTAPGQTFKVDTESSLEWTRVTDCAGIKHFVIQVSNDPGFPPSNRVALRSANPFVSVIAEATDIGPGYARVAAVSTDNRTSAWSSTLSWTVIN